MEINKFTSENIKKFLCNTPQITFEVTEKCNLNCYYCGYGNLYSNKDIRKNNDLSIDKAIIFLNYIKKMWKTEYNISFNQTVNISFYGGEPLINFDFIEQIVSFIENELNNCNRSFIYSMTTNGILLLQHIDYLVKNEFQILISLDGDEHATSHRIFHNGKPAFTQVYNNAKTINEKFPDFFKKNVNFISVLHNQNSIESITNFFQEEFGKTPIIAEINTDGINPEKIEEFKNLFKNKFESIFNSDSCSEIEKKLNFEAPTYNSAFLYLLMNSPYFYMDYNELLFGKKENRKELPSGTCLPFQKKVFITANGKIYPCERIGHEYYLGSISEKDVDIDFEHIAKMYNEYYNKISKMCLKCYDYKSCLCCMFHIGILDNSLSVCKNFMNKKDYDNYLKSQIAFFMRHPETYSEIMNNAVYI